VTGQTIELVGVTKTFPGADRPAVAPLDLTFAAGEITVLIGPSGCGKTTTLRMVNRLIEPTAGTITIDGVDVRDRPVTDLRRDIGYVIQQIGLFPHRTIAKNIATVPSLKGWSKAATADRVEELADLVGIERSMLGRYPSELSGGQQQRVGVARALAADPPVLLMDEPFGAVDPIVRARLQQELKDLQARLHKTIVLVTHDLDEAITLGDKVALLGVGGVIEQFAAPDDLLAEPANGFVADFLGRDRSIRRLALSTVADLDLDSAIPAEDERPETTVTPATSLRDALEVILTSSTPHASVVDDDGTHLGTVTLESIRAGLAR
jgi:osmoprotectant transport system ATP-binding protein